MSSSCLRAAVLIAPILIFCNRVASAQTSPPESTSKVKRVLLYNKVGGWMEPLAIPEVNAVFKQMAEAKGFELDSLTDDNQLTPEFLKKYQVIIWNNNTNGRASVPTASARDAVAEYVHQGGGWLLIRWAADHNDTWPQLQDMLGAKFTNHPLPGKADLVSDSGAKRHPELKHVLAAIPESIRLTDQWFRFNANVRPLTGVTVLYAAKNGEAGVLAPGPDSSDDHPMVWARSIGKGKLLYSSPGQGASHVTAQADSAIPKLYWQSLRWLAGDFQNGCTDKLSPRYDSSARIDDGSCAALSARLSRQPISKTPQIMAKVGQRLRIDLSGNIDTRITIRDLRGAVVFWRTITEITPEFSLDAALNAGVYQLETRSLEKVARYRLIIQ